MFPFTSISSLSLLYNYDRTDDFIESGQFGTVYRAVAMSDRTPRVSKGTAVAVKELAKNKINSEKEMCDVINEVEILKRLHHRNCCQFVEALQTNAHIYIVMELIDDAKDLFAAMREARAPSAREEWSRLVVGQLLSALFYLHRELRVVHRDVKPENILLTTDPQGVRVVLIDYGLAKYLGTSSRPALTPAMLRQRSVEALSSLGSLKASPTLDSVDGEFRSNSPMLSTPCGTLKYLSPETIRGIAENGTAPRSTTRGDLPQSDMYAVGIIVYAMLSASAPFSGSTRGDLIRQMEAGPTFDGAGWGCISLDAQNFVSGLLNPEPSARYTVSQAMGHPFLSGGGRVSHSHTAADLEGMSDTAQISSLLHCASDSSSQNKLPSSSAAQSSRVQGMAAPNKYFAFIGQEHAPMDQS